MSTARLREAYIAARFLQDHGEDCTACALWALGLRRSMCRTGRRAMQARDRADELLGIANTRQARSQAWMTVQSQSQP